MIPNDDIVLIDKPAGMSSFGVVARIRRVLSQQLGKKAKVGHTGTLDPFATGLMILVTGKKCKEAGSFTKLDKWYQAEIILGMTSTTGDPEGELTPMSEHQPTTEEVNQVRKWRCPHGKSRCMTLKLHHITIQNYASILMSLVAHTFVR